MYLKIMSVKLFSHSYSEHTVDAPSVKCDCNADLNMITMTEKGRKEVTVNCEAKEEYDLCLSSSQVAVNL